MMDSISIPDDQKVLFIKLGQGGEWEKECISQSVMWLGYTEASHDLCLARKWNEVSAFYRDAEKKAPATATSITNQIKQFYEESETTIWFTFHAGFLWWCRVVREVTLLPDGCKGRRVIGEWRNTDQKGNLIPLNTLSGKLLQTRGYRGTICTPSATNYLRRRLRGEKMPEVTNALLAKAGLTSAILPVIQHLSFKDFEILVDLIFRQGGWQRDSGIGGTEKDVDLYLYSPATQDRIAIQVKARSYAQELRGYMERFATMTAFDRFFFIVHTGGEELHDIAIDSDVTVIAGQELGELVVRNGLVDWVIDKAG